MNNNGTIYVHDRNLSYGEAEKKISTQRLHGTFVNAGNGKYICISGTKFDGTLQGSVQMDSLPMYDYNTNELSAVGINENAS